MASRRLVLALLLISFACLCSGGVKRAGKSYALNSKTMNYLLCNSLSFSEFSRLKLISEESTKCLKVQTLLEYWTTIIQHENQSFGMGGVAVIRSPLASRLSLWSQCVRVQALGSGTSCELSCLLVLSLATRGFPRVLRFSSLHKNQHFQILIQYLESRTRLETSLWLYL
jgi:hypothetical protein